jgi:phosphoenolpyruvate carboxykinase (ATP)
VTLDDSTREPIFSDSSLTENGRATYPLSFIPGALQEGMAGPPSNIFFLTADAFGVLPAVSKLSPDQALYYFLSGYTAKLAGTEIGLKKVTATFSHCFGAPFMMRKPEVYAQLLMSYIKKLNINVWLINTGWYGGAYGKGQRYELSLTRNIIRSIQRGELDNVYCSTEPYFSLSIPEEVPGVEDSRLLPYNAWSNLNEYNQNAQMLKKLFEKNFEKYNVDLTKPYQEHHDFFSHQPHGHN